jgi:hypothetical protein
MANKTRKKKNKKKYKGGSDTKTIKTYINEALIKTISNTNKNSEDIKNTLKTSLDLIKQNIDRALMSNKQSIESIINEKSNKIIDEIKGNEAYLVQIAEQQTKTPTVPNLTVEPNLMSGQNQSNDNTGKRIKRKLNEENTDISTTATQPAPVPDLIDMFTDTSQLEFDPQKKDLINVSTLPATDLKQFIPSTDALLPAPNIVLNNVSQSNTKPYVSTMLADVGKNPFTGGKRKTKKRKRKGQHKKTKHKYF